MTKAPDAKRIGDGLAVALDVVDDEPAHVAAAEVPHRSNLLPQSSLRGA